jgi:hypothetical protein
MLRGMLGFRRRARGMNKVNSRQGSQVSLTIGRHFMLQSTLFHIRGADSRIDHAAANLAQAEEAYGKQAGSMLCHRKGGEEMWKGSYCVLVGSRCR